MLSKLNRPREALTVLDDALHRMPKYRAALSLQIKIARELSETGIVFSRLSRELNQGDMYSEYAMELRKANKLDQAL